MQEPRRELVGCPALCCAAGGSNVLIFILERPCIACLRALSELYSYLHPWRYMDMMCGDVYSQGV